MIRKNIILTVLFLLNALIVFCADIKYNTSDIPTELLENAKAVVRYENVEFEVISPEKALQKVIFAITIVNKNGLRNSWFVGFYTKFSRISNLHAKVYDQNGEKVKTIFMDDIVDVSAIDGYTLYADNRVKIIDPKYEVYPFTVEYSYDVEYDGCLNYPQWQPYEDYNISVQESGFKVIVPSGYNFRYMENNLDSLCKITPGVKSTSYFWQAKNLKAVLKEDFSMGIEEYLPIVYPAPSDFEIGGYAGNLESWQNFGKWIVEMNKGKDELDEETRKLINNMVSGSENDMEKLKILYNYMQNKTRYVSVQVGIGGWQPFDAKIVDENSYGDCKALSNYMKAILKVAGIQSYYTLIRAGVDKPSCITEFPFNQFNHAIICVPMKDDTVWLECTSQNIPFGYLGTFTDDRPALLITDSGGVLVNTPVLTINDNVQQTHAIVSFETGGIWSKADIIMTSKGLFYDKMRKFVLSDDKDQKKFILENIYLTGFELLHYNFQEDKTRNPKINLNLSLGLNKYGTILNDRLIVPLNLLNKIRDVPLKTPERKSDIQIKRSYQTIDTIEYIIPEDYVVEQIPQNQTITTAFGIYKMELVLTDKCLNYIRKLEMKQGIFPSGDFDKLITFYREIEKCDNAKFILKKI
jgi:hypothetical protein